MRIDSPIMNNAVITGSFSGSFLGSVSPAAGATIEANSLAYSDITSLPTLISSSAQIGVGDGALTQNNFTNTLKSKLDAVEASADVTDATNVTAAGALMDSEVSALALIKGLTAAQISGSGNVRFEAINSATSSYALSSGDGLISASAQIGVGDGALTQNNFTNTLKSKLDAIESSATADQSDAEIRTAVEAASNSNVFTDADHTKLNAIEASADVTDTTNVTSAGALMDSEVSALALIKVLTASQISGSGNVRFEALNAATSSYATKLGSSIVSASVLSSPSQGTVRLATNGVNTDVDSGLQSGDTPTFSGLAVTNNVTISGNLTVLGDAVELGVSNLRVEDKLISIASGAADSAAADGGGLFISGANESITWNHANTRFNFSDDIHVAGGITLTGNVDGRNIDTDGTKLDGIEASADVTDTTNVTAAGALMDSEVSALALIKGLTAAQISGSGNVRFEAIQAATGSYQAKPSEGAFEDGDKTKLDAIEASADVTDTTNVTSAGALMDSELSEIATVKALTAAQISGSGNVRFEALNTATSSYALAAVDLTAGAGLTGGGTLAANRTLNVGAGTGVTVNANDIAIGQAVATSSDVRFDSIGVNTAAPGTSGVIRAASDIIAFYSSDERLKDNVVEIDNALEKVESLRGVEFDWNDKQEIYEGHDVGVIAQDVEKVLPELVENRDNGYKAVKYEKLTAVLIQAVKELSAKVKELESK